MKKYKYPESEKTFELDYISKDGNAYFKCGHWCTDNVFVDLIDLDTGVAQWNNKFKINIIMNKLSKPKSFSVSNETVEVNFKGTVCECANLLKSGITNQTIVLVGHNSVWHETNVLNLGGDDSNLQNFKNFVETMNLSLVDLGITKEEIKTDYSLKHQDFIDLQEKFPPHDYIQISKLNDYNVKNGEKASVYNLTEWLKVCQRDNITIDELIKRRESKKQEIINNSNNMTEKIVPERDTFDASASENQIMDLEITENGQTAISVEKIEVVSAEVMQGGIDLETLPKLPNAPESINDKPAKKPISIQVFETLTPERISELQGLKERQLEIIKANPVVKKITDKTSYELAKKTAAVLLKASTAIDGKEGIEATATKYLNTFKNMLKNALQPIAKITRDPYDEQKQIISAWENAELLREQAEQRAKLEKIKKRTDELFAVPFTFNGTIYSIGTVYCLPSQIENATDEEFKVIVDNGKVIKTALDAEALKNAEKDKEIEELRKKLAALEGLQNMCNTDEPKTAEQPAQASVQQPTPTTDKVSDFMNPNHIPSNVTQKTAATGTSTTGLDYALPSIENTILNKLDLENAEHLEKPAYIKCRSYFIRGSKDLAVEIQKILNDTAQHALKKSERIDNLCNVILKSE